MCDVTTSRQTFTPYSPPELYDNDWGHFTPGNTSFLVMNTNFHFVLTMDVIVCTAGIGNVLRTSVCTNQTVLEVEVLWSGLEFVMMVALSSKLSRNIACCKIQRRYSYHSALSATAKLWSCLSTWQCKMSRGLCLSRLS